MLHKFYCMEGEKSWSKNVSFSSFFLPSSLAFLPHFLLPSFLSLWHLETASSRFQVKERKEKELLLQSPLLSCLVLISGEKRGREKNLDNKDKEGGGGWLEKRRTVKSARLTF